MLDVGCWMLDVGCWMLDVGCWMFDVGCSMLDVRCWMFDVGCSMLEVRFPSREGSGVDYSVIQRFNSCHPADSALQSPASASHACKSASCSHLCVRAIPGRFGYR